MGKRIKQEARQPPSRQVEAGTFQVLALEGQAFWHKRHLPIRGFTTFHRSKDCENSSSIRISLYPTLSEMVVSSRGSMHAHN